MHAKSIIYVHMHRQILYLYLYMYYGISTLMGLGIVSISSAYNDLKHTKPLP